MGKSKRIRSDRARLMVDSPDKFEKTNAAKKSRMTTIILVCVLAAIILATTALVILDNSGTFLRASVVFESDNFEIDGMMTTYLYTSLYNAYYPQLGQYTPYYVNESTITEQAKSLLTLCEGAKAAGYKLEDKDIAKIDKQLDDLKHDAKDAGYSISQVYGEGVTLGDIRKVLELQTLANKFQKDKQETLTNGYLSDADKLNKYFEDHKTDLLKGDYVSIKTDKAEWREELIKCDSVESFKSTFIKLYVTENFVAKYQSGEKKDATDAEKVAVSLLKDLAKAAIEAVDFVAYGTEVKGNDDKELSLDSSDTAVNETMIKIIYESKYKTAYTADAGETGIKDVTDAIYKAAATAADSLRAEIVKLITTKEDYGYPNKTDVSKDNYMDTTAGTTVEGETGTTAGTDSTTAGTTTAAGTTTTTKVDETPASPEELNKFDTWFFSGDRKEKEIFSDVADMLYFVIDPAVKDESLTVNVGHILVGVTSHDHGTAEVDADHKAEEEKELADAKAKAESILAEFTAGTMSKDTFEALADKYTEDSGIFYNNVKKGDMVEEFEEWIYDSARKAGDTGIVKTDYGFHIMYFIGQGAAVWQADTVKAMVSEEMDTWEKGLADTHKVNTVESGLKKIFG